MKCAQDGKSIIAQVHELATFEGCPAMPHELFRGASLLLDVKGKAYPVVFIDYQGTHLYIGDHEISVCMVACMSYHGSFHFCLQKIQ